MNRIKNPLSVAASDRRLLHVRHRWRVQNNAGRWKVSLSHRARLDRYERSPGQVR